MTVYYHHTEPAEIGLSESLSIHRRDLSGSSKFLTGFTHIIEQRSWLERTSGIHAITQRRRKDTRRVFPGTSSLEPPRPFLMGFSHLNNDMHIIILLKRITI